MIYRVKRKIQNYLYKLKSNTYFKHLLRILNTVYSIFRNKKVLVGLCIALFLYTIIFINYSFSFFINRIVSDSNIDYIQAKNINIIFEDTDGEINVSNISSTWTEVKNFTVTNHSDNEYTYNIVIDNLVNTFFPDNIQYKLVCSSSNCNGTYFTSMTDFEGISNTRTELDYILGYKITVPTNVTQSYSLYMRFNPASTEELGSEFSGNVMIHPGNTANFTVNLRVNKNGNIVNSSATAEYGQDVNLPFNKVGYNGTNAVISGDGCVLGGDQTSVTVNKVKKNTTCTINGLSPIKYFINYDSDGGNNNMSYTTCTYDSNCTLKTNTLTKPGYFFAGWKSSSNVTYANGASVLNLSSVNDSIITMTAQWTKVSYTINYSCNGKSGTVASSTHDYDIGKNLNVSTCADGQVTAGTSGNVLLFLGWSTSSSATVPTYKNSENVINLTNQNNDAVNLYAVYGNLFTITGNYRVNAESGTGNWNLLIYGSSGHTSGNVSIVLNTRINIDMFLLSGGSNGGSGAAMPCGDYGYCGGHGGVGGCGGSYITYNNINVSPGTHTIVIGSAGNASSAFDYSSRDSGASSGASGGSYGTMTGYGAYQCYSVTSGSAGGTGIQAFGGTPANYFAAGGGGGGGVNSYNNCFGTGFAPNGEGHARGAGGAGGSSVGGTGGLGGHSGNPAVANSGSGGGGGGGNTPGGAGGSGIIIIRNAR